MIRRLAATAVGAGPDASFVAMASAQVADLACRGHEIGSLSVTHEILPLADDAQLRHELEESRRLLKEWTGTPITGFCYPNGSHNAEHCCLQQALRG